MAAKRHSPPPKDLSGQQQNLVFWCLAIAVFACGVDSAALHGHLPVGSHGTNNLSAQLATDIKFRSLFPNSMEEHSRLAG